MPLERIDVMDSSERQLVKDLDHRLLALGDLPVDHDLSDLEDAVWAKVDDHRPRPVPSWLAMAVFALVALTASALGAATAGTVRTSPLSVFAIHPPTAPSTMLGE